MSKKIKDEQKKFLGETLNQYDKALDEAINQLDKKNREQNHKISSLVNSFDNEYLEKDVEGNMTTLENSKDGMVIIDEIQGNTEVNYCKDGEKELILNGDIDTQGESFVTITEGVDGGLVDVSLEGNTEVNLSSTKDPVLVTREFDDINCNSGKLQYTIDDVTTINDEPGKVDIDRIVGDTMVNHAVNGSEELILNAHIDESGDNNITLNGVISDGGKVDVALEGNTLVNVSNVKDDYITPTIEDKVNQGTVISLPEVSEGLIHIDEIEGNTLVNYCTDGVKELTLNGDIDVEGNFVTTTEGADNGLVDVVLEGNTLVNLLDLGFIDKEATSSNPAYVNSANKEMGWDWSVGQKYNNWIQIGNKINMVQPNKTYTLIANIKQNNPMLDGEFVNGDISGQIWMISCNNARVSIPSGTTGIHKWVFTTTENTNQQYNMIGWCPNSKDSEGNILINGGKLIIGDIMLLEGDYTDKEIPLYFEGMKSAGQDDENGHKIEIVSQNKNLFDGEVEVVEYDSKKRTVNFIKVKPNTSYISNQIFNIHGWYCIEEYDNNFNLINDSNKGFNTGGFTTLENTHYIKLKWDDDYDLTNVMVVEGNTVPTKYISHSSNKKEILLNEPLRGLPSGIKDRFVKIGGKWFIERNLSKVILNGTYSENVRLSRFQAYEDNSERKTIRSAIEIRDFVNLQWENYYDGFAYTMNDKYLSYSDMHEANEKDEEFCCTWDARGIVIQINKSKLSSVDEAGFNSYLQSNPVEVIYRLATPIYEPLETELTLNTYNDTTYISNNSIIPCNMQIKNTGYNAIIKPSTLYTVALYTNRAGTIGINLGGAEVTTTNNVATITTPETLTDDGLRFSGKNINSFKIMLLEGDRTNRLPNFFEGMKSSFEDKVQEDDSYKMKILMSNKNLVRLTSENAYGLRAGSSYIIHSENSLTLKGTTSYSSIKFKQKLKPLTEYHISCDATLKKGSGATIRIREECLGVPDAYTVLYNSGSITVNDKVHINGTFTTKNVTDIAIYPNSSWDIEEESELLIENLQISEVEGDYVESKSNEIQLSSIAPLRGVGDVHDRLVSKDGKLMIERNCGALTIDSSQGFIRETKYNNGNLYGFEKDFSDIKPSPLWYKAIVCDKYSYYTYTDDAGMSNLKGEWIGSWSNNKNRFAIMLRLRTKEDTLDSLNEYLTENPINIVYIKKEPTYEEIPYNLQKLILESYANGTLFFDTNIPPTKVSFNCFEEELTYLYPSTSYTIQFISDRTTTADVNLGGTELLAQNIVYGINRISITTPETLANNKLVIDGTGANIREIVVTDTDREFGYFEGMKSVGECEDLEVVSSNKNLLPLNHKFEVGSLDSKGFPVDNSVRRRSKNFIKVNPTNDITLFAQGVDWTCIVAYDRNKKYIAQSSADYTTISLHSDKLIYYVKIQTDVFSTITNIQLEEGSTATDYIPHASNTQTLTHEPLRAVGDIKDKYVLIDGKWYIERNCAEVVFDGSEDEIIKGYTDSVNTHAFGINDGNNNNVKYMKVCLSNNFIGHGHSLGGANNSDIETITVGSSVAPFVIYINKNKLISNDVVGFRQWLQQNPTTVVYQLKTPTYEPIDYDPFTVYSDITHISNNSTIPCNMIIKNHGYNTVALKENTQYTLYVNKNTTNALTYRLGDYVEINSLSKFTFTTPSTLTDKTLRIDGKGAKVNDLMLIEGTPTNDPVGYFDGLKSSYECEQVTDENDENYGKYKVDIKVVGKNLFDKSKTLDGYEIANILSGAISENADWFVTDFIPVIPNTSYKISGKDNGNVGLCYDKNKQLISHFEVGCTSLIKIPNNVRYVKLNGLLTQKDTFQLEEGNTATEYEPYFESIQTVYLNSPLLKGDEIVWKDNKIQHYHKMKTIVLDGSDDENISIETTLTKDNTIGFKYYDDNIASVESYCDKFMYEFSFEDKEHHVNNPGWLCFLISKSKLQTQDIAGFKQWLQQNTVTVAYQLATPYYEEISVYPLKLNVIANSSLSTESTIQVTNISFNVYEETLPYLYPNTKYYITFNADVDRNNIVIDLGGSHIVFDCKVGFNKVEITTPSDTTNLLTFSGTGVNIDHVKVTQQDIDEYFEGMKSVGECENNTLEIICKNDDNSKSTTQTLTHEPLRAVGDIKDKYVLIDGKWYIERNCAEVVLDGSDDEGWGYSPSTNPGHCYITIANSNIYSYNSFICDKLLKATINPSLSETSNNYGISMINVSTNAQIKIRLTSNDTLSSVMEYLKINSIKIVYLLKTPQYEPIDYNPFTVYSNVTHISNNSTIPCNMIIKNHGYNTILKPSTTYTVALNKSNETIGASLGGSSKVESTNNVFTITTPSTLTDNCLRLYGKGIKSKDVIILEGDKTNYIPGYFEGLESAFEQEYDEEKGKYKVKAKVVGKNLFNINQEPYIPHLYREYMINNKSNQLTLTLTNKDTSVDITGCSFGYHVDGKFKAWAINSGEVYTTKYTNNITALTFYPSTQEVFDKINARFNIQLEYGNTATPYESYKESVIEFYIDEPLRGIGDVKDKVYVKDDKVVVERNCGSVTLDGSEDENWSMQRDIYGKYRVFNSNKYTYNNRYSYGYSKYFPSVPYGAIGYNYTGEGCGLENNNLRISIANAKLSSVTVAGFKQWLQQNPTTVVYQLAEPVYEEVDCDLSKLVLENYENSSLIFESNIPISANIRYSGEVPIVTQAKSLSSQVDNTTLDINENIIPYMCDIDYRIVELQLMNGDTQGEGIELLGIGDIEILGNENVLFNNREDKKYNYSYDMLKRDILSQRYSKEEYQYRLDRYLLANKISDEEYKELEGLLNNGE